MKLHLRVPFRAALMKRKWTFCSIIAIAFFVSLVGSKDKKQPNEPLQVYDFRSDFKEPPHLTFLDVSKYLVPQKELQQIDSTHRHGLVHAGAWITIADSNGFILVLKRGSHLVTCPNSWGLVGEHALGRETPLDTVKRGIKEELGQQMIKHVKSIKPMSALPPYYFRDYGSSNENRVDRQVTYLWWVQMDKPGRQLPLKLDEEVADHQWLEPELLEIWLQQARQNLEDSGEVGTRICHHTILTLWELIMELYSQQKEDLSP